MYMFWSFCIVAVICLTTLVLIKMALKHAENMKRISHGYPTRDGSKPLGYDERVSVDASGRIQ